MDLHVSLRGQDDLSGQIYRQLRAAIVSARLRPGDALPPSRYMAARLGVGRNTVTTAYVRLAAEGFLETRVGAGSFVAPTLGAGPMEAGPRSEAQVPLAPRAIWTALAPAWPRRALPHAVPAPRYDFRVGMPDPRLFPYATWRRLLSREVREGSPSALGYGDPAGEPRLRSALARHLALSRSLRIDAAAIVVTAGAQQALDLLGRVLLEPGATVAVEDPGYPVARALFAAHGASVVGVPVDDEGLVVPALPDDAKIVYVTPAHQFPLGMPMSLGRRLELLRWAERRGCLVVEDDYDSEFRYGGRPIDPLHALDRRGVVAYVGSFSKTLLPSLRLGCLVAPPSLLPALHAAKHFCDWHAPTASQAALAELLDGGGLARHLRAARKEYGARHLRLQRALLRHLAGIMTAIPSEAGLHLTARFDDARVDARKVARIARAMEVGVMPLTLFAAARIPAGLALGYGGIEVSRIDEGVRRLARAIAAASPP